MIESPLLRALVLAAAGVVVGSLGWHAQKRREIPGATSLAIMALGVVVWTFAAAVYQFAADTVLDPLLIGLHFAGISALPPAWVSFSLRLSGRSQHLSRVVLTGGLLAGIVMTLLVVTNAWHYLIWRDDINGVSRPYTGYWIFLGYTYVLTVVGVVVLTLRALSGAPVYRAQSVLMIGAGLSPIPINLATELGGLQTKTFDPTPLSFFVSTALIWWGLFRFRLLDLVPVARGLLLENMEDAVLVVDTQERLLDLNPVAARLPGNVGRAAVGRPASELFSWWGILKPHCVGDRPSRREFQLGPDDSLIWFEARSVPIRTPEGAVAGFLILMRDISERRKAEIERERLIWNLKAAKGRVESLSGLLPICSGCQKIRDDSGIWHQLDAYLLRHTQAQLTHGLCPGCLKRLYPEFS